MKLLSFAIIPKIIILLALQVVLSSCVSNSTQYYWGGYENNLYTQYNKPGDATPEVQIEKMRADILKANSKNQPMPPGFYAHLGYQYLLTGKAVQARNCFTFEKKSFPESAVMMDRFLTKLK